MKWGKLWQILKAVAEHAPEIIAAVKAMKQDPPK